MRRAVTTLEALADRARAGDAGALEDLLGAVQDRVYGLAVRMLGDPADAQDATQEVLVKVARGLGSYRGESALATWVYRVASNHLLTARQRRAESMGLSFEALGAMLDQGLAVAAAREPEPVDRLLEEEVKLGCTHSALLCLDREHRLAFILGEVLELSGEEAAAVLGLGHDAYRKRLSRARARLRAFMQARCGLVDESNPCRCAGQVPYALQVGLVDPAHLRFATHPTRAAAGVRELERLERVTAVFRAHPEYAAPAALAEGLREQIGSGRYGVLAD